MKPKPKTWVEEKRQDPEFRAMMDAQMEDLRASEKMVGEIARLRGEVKRLKGWLQRIKSKARAEERAEPTLLFATLTWMDAHTALCGDPVPKRKR